MTDVLITAGELAEFLNKEPCVVIDTRNPEAYGAGHLPGAVNVHEIFTYLATSTPEGMRGTEDEICRRVRRCRALGQGDRGHLRTVDEFRLRPVVPRLLFADHAGLSQDQGAAWRLRRLGGGGPACHQEVPSPVKASFSVLLEAGDIPIDAKTMLAAVGKPGIALLDVRDIDEWIGESSSPYGKDFCPRKGRIPGAVWLEWYRMMKPTAEGPRFKSKNEILAECATVGITQSTPVYLYCLKGARPRTRSWR